MSKSQSKKSKSRKGSGQNIFEKIIIVILLLAALGVAAYRFVKPKQTEIQAGLIGNHHVEIDVRDYGTIKAELYGDIAPITVENFLKLARAGFYDGLTFHRIISGFMIQGGDPRGDGTGGSPDKIKGEFAANGITNTLKHTRGVLSMARSSAYDSASSQFFIMHKDSSSLDGQYAAFGMVTSGIEVVDAICENTPVQDNNGTVSRENQPVITAVRVID